MTIWLSGEEISNEIEELSLQFRASIIAAGNFGL